MSSPPSLTSARRRYTRSSSSSAYNNFSLIFGLHLEPFVCAFETVNFSSYTPWHDADLLFYTLLNVMRLLQFSCCIIFFFFLVLCIHLFMVSLLAGLVVAVWLRRRRRHHPPQVSRSGRPLRTPLLLHARYYRLRGTLFSHYRKIRPHASSTLILVGVEREGRIRGRVRGDEEGFHLVGRFCRAYVREGALVAGTVPLAYSL